MTTHLKIADLSKESVSKLKELENELGLNLMAYEPEVTLAAPTEEQLTKIKELEKELKITLLAYEK